MCTSPPDGCDLLFYDGHCALCHRWVRRLLRHDAEGRCFRFAPRGGETFERELDTASRGDPPDAVVVKTADGEVRAGAAAVRHIVDRLGRPPALFLLTLPFRLPPPVDDAIYRLIARVRFKLFGRTDEACPTLDPAQRDRFLP